MNSRIFNIFKISSFFQDFPDFEYLDDLEYPSRSPYLSTLTKYSPDVQTLVEWLSPVPLNVVIISQILIVITSVVYTLAILCWTLGRLMISAYSCFSRPGQGQDSDTEQPQGGDKSQGQD